VNSKVNDDGPEFREQHLQLVYYITWYSSPRTGSIAVMLEEFCRRRAARTNVLGRMSSAKPSNLLCILHSPPLNRDLHSGLVLKVPTNPAPSAPRLLNHRLNLLVGGARYVVLMVSVQVSALALVPPNALDSG
jgi:hypothetical protein